MKHILASLAIFAVAGAAASGAGPDPNLDYNVLQGRIASLESKVRTLETALRELSAKVVEPSPTQTGAPAPKTAAPTQAEAPLPAPPAPAPTSEAKKYVITESDTISEIARKLNVPRSELMAANGLREGQQIYIGDELIIPQPKTQVAQQTPPVPPKTGSSTTQLISATQTATPPAPSPAQSISYKVKAGDTLSKIARENNTSVAALKSTNKLNSDNLSIGQTLKIPASGSSKTSVAANTGSAPAPSPSTSAAPSVSKNVNKLLRPDETYGLYTIERGDTLYSLARDFFTTQAELQRLNEMGQSTVLRPGQDIVVPTSKYTSHHQLANNG